MLSHAIPDGPTIMVHMSLSTIRLSCSNVKYECASDYTHSVCVDDAGARLVQSMCVCVVQPCGVFLICAVCFHRCNTCCSAAASGIMTKIIVRGATATDCGDHSSKAMVMLTTPAMEAMLGEPVAVIAAKLVQDPTAADRYSTTLQTTRWRALVKMNGARNSVMTAERLPSHDSQGSQGSQGTAV